jgi:hypothetical protein
VTVRFTRPAKTWCGPQLSRAVARALLQAIPFVVPRGHGISRHARNEMRLHGLAEADVAEVVARPEHLGKDSLGNARLQAHVRGDWSR